MKKLLVLVLFLFIGWFSYLLVTKEKVVGNTIVLGQSAALSGISGETGRALRDGANAYFKYINAQGGIYNRKIKLISLDDFYEPRYAKHNTLELINKHNVFALFGEFGTPTSKAVLPIVKKYNIPFLFPFSGADFLRHKNESLVINLRRSYKDEVDALIEYLQKEHKINKIAVFFQNDSYGQSGYTAVENALKKRNLQMVAEGRFRRNTYSYRNALNTINKAKPDAVIMFGTYKPIGSFIESARKIGMDETLFCNISFGGSFSLIERLNYNATNLIFSQVVPLPWDLSNPVAQEYQKIYKKFYRHSVYSIESYEGYLSAKLLVEALKKAGKKLTREKFLKSFYDIEKNAINGFEISLSETKKEALDKVYINDFYDGKFRLIKEIEIK